MTRERQVAVILGTRPEAIKLAPVVIELQKRPGVRPFVIHTAQHREMADDVLLHFGVKPDVDLNLMKANQSPVDTAARLLERIGPVFTEHQPDFVLVQGDTTTTLAGALAAFYMRIPVGHIEAGLRTQDRHQPFPEEINRRLTTPLAELHFPPTETAQRALLAERVPSAMIEVTGNTVIDALLQTLDRLEAPVVPSALRKVLVTCHRRENHGAPLARICDALLRLRDEFDDIEVVYPVHPHPKVREIVDAKLGDQERITLLEPLSYAPFVQLMSDAYLLLTDSGGVQEEAPSLGKPVLVLREKTERPEAVEAGTVTLVGTDTSRIFSEASRLLQDQAAYDRMSRAHNPYGDGKASARIVDGVIRFLDEHSNGAPS